MFPDLTRDDVYRIETARLWLRWPRANDAVAVQAFAGVKIVAEQTASWKHPLPPGEAERRLFAMRKLNATGQALVLALALKQRPMEAIGLIGGHADTEGALDLGYMLAAEQHGRGLMTEAMQGFIDAIFSYTEFREVRAEARVTNPASRRVLEKCGFGYEGAGMRDLKARGGLFPVDRFHLTRPTWESLKRWRAPVVTLDRGQRQERNASPDRQAAPC
jgi:RimJ/RimL family protein N-acetyltransferase